MKLRDVWNKLWMQKKCSFVQSVIGHQQQIKKAMITIPQDPHYPFVNKEIFKLNESGTVLEAGCGIGQWVFYAQELGHQAIGVDVSDEAIKTAVAYSRECKTPCYFALGDVRKLSFATNSFDCVFSFGVIEHFADPQNALSEFYRVLRQSGRCFVSVPNVFSIHPVTNMILRLIGKRPIWREDLYSPLTLAKLVKQAGFKNVTYGIVPSGWMFGAFPSYIPVVGKFLMEGLLKVSYFIESRQSVVGFLSYSIGEK